MNESENDTHPKDGLQRRQFSPAERERLLSELDRSGISGAAFARQQGIGYSTLAAWRRKHNRRKADSTPPPESPFVEVRLQRPSGGGGMVIRTGELELEVREAVHLEWAERLLRTWREATC